MSDPRAGGIVGGLELRGIIDLVLEALEHFEGGLGEHMCTIYAGLTLEPNPEA